MLNPKLKIVCKRNEIISGKLSPKFPSNPLEILKNSTNSHGTIMNINLNKLVIYYIPDLAKVLH